MQLVDKPTHQLGSTIDLLLTTDPDMIDSAHTAPSPTRSDHMPIYFDVYVEPVFPKVEASRLDYRRMDISAIACDLDLIDWKTLLVGMSVSAMFDHTVNL